MAEHSVTFVFGKAVITFCSNKLKISEKLAYIPYISFKFVDDCPKRIQNFDHAEWLMESNNVNMKVVCFKKTYLHQYHSAVLLRDIL